MPNDPIPTPDHKPTLSRPEDQPSWAVGTNTYTFIVTGNQTDGAFAFFDGHFPPKGHVGPHCHGYEEMLYVLDGELTVFCDDQRHVLSVNTALNVPAWAPHMLRKQQRRTGADRRDDGAGRARTPVRGDRQARG